MRERFSKLTQSVDRLTLRERLFLLAAVLVVLSGMWEAVLAAPLDARQKAAGVRITELHDRIEQINQSIAVAAEGMSEGMPSQLDRVRALRERVLAGDDTVRIYTTDLVDPTQMRVVLEDLIRRQTGLKLVSATNLPPRPLFANGDDKEAEAKAQTEPSSATPRLYRHALVLKVEGSYLDCLAYLQSVERLPWHLYWARLEFTAGEYPRNDITIELHTLSLAKEWIGV